MGNKIKIEENIGMKDPDRQQGSASRIKIEIEDRDRCSWIERRDRDKVEKQN
jgi:hypothetical protein